MLNVLKKSLLGTMVDTVQCDCWYCYQSDK